MITERVELGERSYDVVIGDGARHELSAVLPAGAKRVAVVTQGAVPVEVDTGRETKRFEIGGGEAPSEEQGLGLGHPGQLLRDGDLHVMAWKPLVVGNDFQHVLRHRTHVGKVRVIDAWTRPIRCPWPIVLCPTILFAESLHPAHL